MSGADNVSHRQGRLGGFLRRPWLVGGCLAIACFGIGMAISLANWPVPRVHDEFSYLLAADTFAHGRLTNPTHPKWEHLETFHEIFQPTYASKYPPGQGLALAAGQVTTGQPAVGLWLMSGLAAAATYWMLVGLTTSRYAALGALLWIAHPRFQLVWGQTFWGGTLAYIGGALVFGAAVRMQRRALVRDAIVMATGALVLAVTRPFEGFVFCAATGVWVVYHWFRHGWPPFRQFLLRLALPQAVILMAGAFALGTYHKAVTGHATTFPYAVHEAAYGQSPMFIGGSPTPRPPYRHAVFDDFHSVWELGWYERQATVREWLYTKTSVTWLAGLFFLTSIMCVGILASLPWRWTRLTPAVAIAAITYAATLAVTWYNPHYDTPDPKCPVNIVTELTPVRTPTVLAISHRTTGQAVTLLVEST